MVLTCHFTRDRSLEYLVVALLAVLVIQALFEAKLDNKGTKTVKIVFYLLAAAGLLTVFLINREKQQTFPFWAVIIGELPVLVGFLPFMSRKAEIAKKERESVMRYIQAKQILSKDLNINIYRGCTHGCIYCDSRSSCYQIDDFENVMVKENALDLLGQELAKKRSKGIITSGSMSDPYVHIEKDLQYTRKMLEIILEYGFGINILTKSALILRDLDLYRKINAKTGQS